MNDQTRFARLQELGVFHGLAARDTGILFRLLEHLELSMLDCLTMRDLLQLTDLQHDAAMFAVLALMFALMAEGSLCLDVSLPKLTAKLAAACGLRAAERLAGRFQQRLAQKAYAVLISEDKDDYLPLVLAKSVHGKLLYFQRLYVHEKSLAQHMEALLAKTPPATLTPGQVDDTVEALFTPSLCLRRAPGGRPLEKDPRQVEALKLCLKRRFGIVSGGPGTGKTSLMVNLVRALVRCGTPAERIAIGAPTGRAAQRMTEALQHYMATIAEPEDEDRQLSGLAGSTLHKMLGYRRDRNDFRYTAANPLPAGAIVLDEVSMVDVVMMDRFLQAVDAAGTRLVFLGDRDQLPSVEAGAVFARMIPLGTRGQRFRKHMVLLDKVHRAGKQLSAFAAALNSGKAPRSSPVSFGRALRMPADNWCRVSGEGDLRWRQDLTDWLRFQYLQPRAGRSVAFRDAVIRAKGRSTAELLQNEAGKALMAELFSAADGGRILSLVRHGPLGCNAINRFLAAELSLSCEQVPAAPGELFGGAVVMITRNDYTRQLFNGEVGLALRDAAGLCRVYFQRAGGFVCFPQDQLPAWEFGYAMTVHKSQGSEFDDVLLVLPPDENHRLLSREIIYTGVTRARRRVMIYGRQKVLDAALTRRVERTSGLIW